MSQSGDITRAPAKVTINNSSSSQQIEKLEGGSNYSTWAFAMQMHLTDHDLWEYVESPQDQDQSDFKRKDAKARAKICLCVNTNIYPVVQNCKSAKDTWEKLKNTYADSGLLRRLNLLKKLFQCKLEQFNSMECYVNCIRTTQQQLVGINAAVDEEFIGIIMLAGLPEEYNPLVMAVEHSGTKLTADSVASLLIKEEQRKEPSSSKKSALAVTAHGSKQGSSKFCTFCKKPGHLVSECRKKKKQVKKVVKNNNTNFDTSTNYTSDFTLSSSFHSSSSPTDSQDVWYLDSGATTHMSNKKDHFINLSSLIKPITVANNAQILSEGKGTVCLHVSKNIHRISDVLYVPKLNSNLLSVSSLVKKGYIVLFSTEGAYIYLKNNFQISGQAIATASNYRGMYKLDTCENANVTIATDSVSLWHRRLGHLNIKSMNCLRNKKVGIDYVLESSNATCIPCIQGKLAKKPFKKSKSRSHNILDLIHSDLCGPMSTHSFGGALYLLTFTDDISRKTFGYFLKTKSEVFSKFIDFKHLVENQTGRKIKVLRSDNGREYVNGSMSTFLRENGIIHQTTVPYNPQQNGVAERVNRTIFEKARAMLFDAKLPKAYWAEAVNTAIYLKNHSPTQSLKNRIPEEIWTGKQVNLSHLRVFGCEAHVLIPKEKRTKLEPKTQTCKFVGYATESKGYRLINPNNPKAIIIARDVVFIENSVSNYPPIPNPSYTDILTPTLIDIEVPATQDVQLEEPIPSISSGESSSASSPTHAEPLQSSSDESPQVPTVEPDLFIDAMEEPPMEPLTSHPESEVGSIPERRYPTRERKPPVRFGDSVNLSTTDNEPETYKQAIKDPHHEEWSSAMQSEYNSLLKHGTWDLVDRPTDRKIIKNKWVYKIKRNTNGEIVKYKARLVAKGFTQVQGVDYGETFSPVARLSSVRIMLAFAVQLNVQLDHLDVETAFLNGDLDEEIYMEQPEGFQIDGKNKVCRLKKSLYGLKQAPRQWNLKVSEALNKLSLTQAQNEHCLYYRREGNDLLVVAVFVDDFFIMCTNESMKNCFKEELKKLFTIKDLGPLKDCLGMRVTQKDGQITVDQTKYIENLIEKFNMIDAIPVTTPMETGTRLVIPDKEEEKPDLPYQQLIGSLMYVAIGTRPDISFAVSYLSQFNAHYGEGHWKAAKRVLRYLKYSKDLKLTFSKNSGEKYPVGYADADYGSSPVDRRSYTGYTFKLCGASISWESRKQRTPALSTTEAEYMALTAASKEAIYLRNLIQEVFGIIHPITIYNDNQSSLKLIRNNTYHSRTKHIDIKHHFIRQLSQSDFIFQYIPTNEMTADILTKPLTRIKHSRFTILLGLG